MWEAQFKKADGPAAKKGPPVLGFVDEEGFCRGGKRQLQPKWHTWVCARGVVLKQEVGAWNGRRRTTNTKKDVAKLLD